MTKNASNGNTAELSDAPTLRNCPLPKSPVSTRSITAARITPKITPSSDPTAPSAAPSPIRAPSNSPRVTPSARSKASDRRLRSTDSDWVENTRNAPVHSATSASMLRFTR